VFEQRQDYFGNHVPTFAVFQSHDHLSAAATSIVEVEPAAFPQASVAWEDARAILATQADEEILQAYEFVFDSPYAGSSEDLAQYARAVFTPGRPLTDAAIELSGRIHNEF